MGEFVEAQQPQHRSIEPERWVAIAEECEAAAMLSQQLHLPHLISRILVSRGIDTAEAARDFLFPSLDQLHDPLLMLGMRPAVDRLRSAILRGEPILVYGDYDADGTVATVLLKTGIERAAVAMGASADVRYHIPHRIREGYGIQDQRIEAAAAEGVQLVISVDTGIRAFAAAAEARRVGLDLIVTDHHLPDETRGLPEALAVINPNQPGCPYPFKGLCGAGVAFKLAQALLESATTTETDRARLREKTVPSFLKLLAVATIADAVPLNGENRTIVSLGLLELRKPSKAGLRTLLQLAQVDLSRPISASDVGFRVAPRINAAGRMDIASDVVEMLLNKDADVSVPLAEKLHRLNDERRASEALALRAIEVYLEGLESNLPPCFVLDDSTAAVAWHRGVIGILASRVVDRTGRPALVLTHEDGIAYGSGRSVDGFHLLDALSALHYKDTEPLFDRYGGHAHAVGFALPSDRVPLLRERLERVAGAHRELINGARTLACDAEIALCELTEEFLATLERLGPFGNGHEEPLFLSRRVRLAAIPRVIKERHLRLTIEDEDGGHRLSGVAWSRKTDWAVRYRTEEWQVGSLLDVAFRLRRNWNPEFAGWELEVVAIRTAASDDDRSHRESKSKPKVLTRKVNVVRLIY